MNATYDMTTATAYCNDQQADTWEVQAQDADGKWWTVSDSSRLGEIEAEHLAEAMRRGV